MPQFTEEQIRSIKTLLKEMTVSAKKVENAKTDLQDKVKKLSSAIGDGAGNNFDRTLSESKRILGEYYLEQSDL